MFDKLDGLASLLRAAGLKADTDATKLTLPGVWIAPQLFTPVATLCGDGRWTVAVALIAADRSHEQSRRQLDDLWNAVRVILEPDSPLRVQTVSVTAGGAPMPALIFDLVVDDLPVDAD